MPFPYMETQNWVSSKKNPDICTLMDCKDPQYLQSVADFYKYNLSVRNTRSMQLRSNIHLQFLFPHRIKSDKKSVTNL